MTEFLETAGHAVAAVPHSKVRTHTLSKTHNVAVYTLQCFVRSICTGGTSGCTHVGHASPVVQTASSVRHALL
jgi:hypothetical protein